MTHLRRLLALLLTVAALTLGMAAVAHAQPGTTTRYAGTLPDGASWIADVPANWNRTILLCSHGYVPGPDNPPRNSPNQPTADALLARGYALAGSSYSRPGWALATAADDQFATLAAVRAITGPPRHVIAVGTSMGGLVTGQLAQRGGRQIDGALAACGIMGGGIDLHNSQLDGLHALNELLLPDQKVKTGSLRMPVLAIHTTNDPLVAVEHEEEYAEDVDHAGDRALLRQAYTDHPGHCTFTTAELVAGVETVRTRIETGRWDGLTTPRHLQALAESLNLGPAAFVRFRPGEFLSDRRLPHVARNTAAS